MKILYIHQYFKPPTEPGGTRSYWIAQELLKNGHDVTFISASTKYKEKVKKVNVDGINVIYIKEEYSQNMSVLQRLKVFTTLMIKSTVLAVQQKEIDLVIATSTPLSVGVPALLLKKLKKIPYVFEVRDLWPDVPIQMGALKNSTIIQVTRWLEEKIYKNAAHVIALSPGMQDGVIKYIPKENTSMIPNMSKIDEFWPRQKNTELILKLGLKVDSFKIIHFGSLGKANGAHSIIESAKLMKDINDVEFLFVGGGSTETDLINEVNAFQLENVKFLSKFPMKEVSEIVNFCDISIISFLDIPILYTNSPNKLFDSLSAGKPIIVNSAGWTKNITEEYNCGYYVNPNNPQDLVDKINHLKNNPNVTRQMGKNSRKLAETIYDKSILTQQFVNTIHSLKLH